jgi:rhodanese-related sulfurtransferase
MNDAPFKPRVLELLYLARKEEQDMVAGLSEAERDATGTPEQWSAKDFVANITAWEQLQIQKLAAAVRGETPPVWRDMDLVNQINAQIFAEHQNLPWQDVQDEAERVFAGLVAQVDGLTGEELTDPYRYDWQDGEPLWAETLGNGFWHPYSQLTRFYRQRGDREYAMHVQESLVEALRRVDMPPDTVGGAIYNLACFYATNGWPGKALEVLPEALRLRPTLVEWSKQDTDLDVLRTEPAFQALYEDPLLKEGGQMSDLISPQEVRDQQDTSAELTIIDVRGAKEYEAGHVKGAMNVPLSQLPRKLAQIPGDRLVVTYCNMHHRGESRGERAAALLRERGYQALALDGGYPGWREEGLPVE